ncbi:hypothetical protein [Arthrobacter sp. ERGS1:01]|uniref:hypothetical protein n=1 Tax=Arthrobacter sp. ERGS1:01 TaxID=1704044 RepID=UPI0012375218|nr:hypothetical protein [Arthrobacter sp. ERGS1:01]
MTQLERLRPEGWGTYPELRPPDLHSLGKIIEVIGPRPDATNTIDLLLRQIEAEQNNTANVTLAGAIAKSQLGTFDGSADEGLLLVAFSEFVTLCMRPHS